MWTTSWTPGTRAIAHAHRLERHLRHWHNEHRDIHYDYISYYYSYSYFFCCHCDHYLKEPREQETQTPLTGFSHLPIPLPPACAR